MSSAVARAPPSAFPNSGSATARMTATMPRMKATVVGHLALVCSPAATEKCKLQCLDEEVQKAAGWLSQCQRCLILTLLPISMSRYSTRRSDTDMNRCDMCGHRINTRWLICIDAPNDISLLAANHHWNHWVETETACCWASKQFDDIK